MGPARTGIAELDGVLTELVDTARDVLGDDLVGVYLQGSFALGEADDESDCDVVSKPASVAWALDVLDQQWRPLLETALAERGRRPWDAPIDPDLAEHTMELSVHRPCRRRDRPLSMAHTPPRLHADGCPRHRSASPGCDRKWRPLSGRLSDGEPCGTRGSRAARREPRHGSPRPSCPE